MKTTKYIAIAATCLLALACTKGSEWDIPEVNPVTLYGNNSINEENIISIAELKSRYPNINESTDQNKLIEDDIKIRGRVTANDIRGNIYKQFIMQDATGAIIVAVNESGISGYLAEGQEIILSLKDLYIGGYRKQPEIGMPYNGTSIGRMQKDIFQKHFRYAGDIDASVIQPMEFDVNMSKEEHSAKLVTLKNVSFTPVDGLGTLAPDTAIDKTVTLSGGCVNRALNEYPESKVVIRTSTYAKFAAMKLPYDEVNKKPLMCNITGIATRYNDVWQILIRKDSDIEVLDNKQ